MVENRQKSDFTLLGPILYPGTKNDLRSFCKNLKKTYVVCLAGSAYQQASV